MKDDYTKKSLLSPEILAISTRNSLIENIYYGWICLIDKNKKVLYKSGNIKDKTYLRSVAKPIQALPLLDSNIKISEKELSIICASHSGSKQHLKVLEKLLSKYKLKTSDLKCGTHYPLDSNEALKLRKSNKKPSTLHNNCSGKHIGLITTCKKNNWSTKNYLSTNSKIQKKILHYLQNLSEYKQIEIGIDGCGVPTFNMPIRNIGILFSNFTSIENTKYKKIINAMKNHPYILGGKNRIDSEIISASKGSLISKVGAGGLIIVSKDGKSLVVKIADGNMDIRSIVTLRMLLKLKWLTKKDLKNTPLEKIEKGHVMNLSNVQVGNITTFI